jgi:acyl carrier protein
MNEINVVNLVIASINEILSEENEDASEPVPQIEPSTILLGKTGILDSHALVSAIVNIEEKLNDDHALDIVIADERAMSQEKSPFRTVNSLAEYISMLIKEQPQHE